MVIRAKAKSKIKGQEPNPAFEGPRGYATACFLGVRPPAPLNSGVDALSPLNITQNFHILEYLRNYQVTLRRGAQL